MYSARYTQIYGSQTVSRVSVGAAKEVLLNNNLNFRGAQFEVYALPAIVHNLNPLQNKLIICGSQEKKKEEADGENFIKTAFRIRTR
jgi:hypothetical protein